jgi:deazaflavin-dependent oxidoreductase (nitroreductase family)
MARRDASDLYGDEHVRRYRETDGDVGYDWNGAPTLLLTTTGRRTGEPRTTPMMFHRDGDRVLVIASNAGGPRHPDWYRNLVAHREVTVEVGDESGAPRRAAARTLEGDERTAVWEMLKATYPFFAEHELSTARTIPVVALVPREESTR